MVDQTFENRYQNLTPIGEGGMGQVFRAFDTLLQKHVAIKVLTNTLSDGAKIRFQTEARVTARLNHPNIIGILNFGLTGDHSPYMVMEWVDGQDLSEFLRQHNSLHLRDALQVFFQIGAALTHAHGKGVIHRDLKPANVLLFEDENGLSIKLLDFGIAKVFQDEHQSLTASGTLLGSPLYMSPEQCAGEKADARSDIYSFGCLMYACLAGRPPLRGATAIETMSLHRNTRPEPLGAIAPNTPGWLDEIILKCLEKKPEDRYQNTAILVTALNEAYEASEIRTAELDNAAASASSEAAQEVKATKPKLPVGILMTLLAVSIVFITWMCAVGFKNPVIMETSDDLKKPFVTLTSRELTEIKALNEPGIELQGNTARGTNLVDEQLTMCSNFPGVHSFNFLESPEITGSGLKFLVQLKPKSIKLRAGIKDRYFKYFSRMRELEYLKLDNVESLDGSGFANLRNLERLEYLSLERCKLTNIALRNIALVRPVKILELKGTFGYDANGLAYLRGHPLKVLDLTAVEDLNDETASGLGRTHISTLLLNRCHNVTDKSLDVVKTIEGLQTFVYTGTGITRRGAAKLARALGFANDGIKETMAKH
ncbi:serine/threonine protein kinase [Candidatus Obscuribacterales bacterium]|nr:serine/threonine protein kinase [Candidatus Obscuribacterales bacterium]